jgi:hypothetical protein
MLATGVPTRQKSKGELVRLKCFWVRLRTSRHIREHVLEVDARHTLAGRRLDIVIVIQTPKQCTIEHRIRGLHISECDGRTFASRFAMTGHRGS